MTPFAQGVTTLLSIGTIIAQIFIVLVFLGLLMKKDAIQERRGLGALVFWVSKYALELGLLVSVGSIIASLFYSNVVGFAPCTLCWWQRVFIYPQAVIFAVALYYKKKGQSVAAALASALILTVIGGLIALYQFYGSAFNPDALAACSAEAVSCAKQYFVSFGYITIPVMSLTCFVLLTIILISQKRAHA